MAFENHDFDYDILNATSHRPWPIPNSPWIMTQSWHDLLFAHWPVSVADLRARLPRGLELDLFDGQAWLAVVPFRMTNVAPRGVPSLPWVSAFPELNVRTYVRAEGKAGVFFFSLDAGNPLAVLAARKLFHLPYYSAAISSEAASDDIRYDSRRTSDTAPEAVFHATYGPDGPIQEPAPGSIAYFLTERYCLFTLDGRSRLSIVEIHHPPWPLQPAHAEIRANSMADAAGIRLPPIKPLLHFSRRQDVVAWRPKNLGN